MANDADDVLPYGVALLLLGFGTAVVTFGSMVAPDVTYVRSEWTACLAMALSAWTVVELWRGRFGGSWWRAFWIAGFLAYALHFWWAVHRVYNDDFAAIILKQGRVAAYANFFATAIWLIDAIIWLPPKLRQMLLLSIPQTLGQFIFTRLPEKLKELILQRLLPKFPNFLPPKRRQIILSVFHGFVWLWVMVSFVVSSAPEFRPTVVRVAGFALAIARVWAIVSRIHAHIRTFLAEREKEAMGALTPTSRVNL